MRNAKWNLHFSLNGVYSDQNTHHSWDAESCWWGRSWASETTDKGCFQLQCHNIRLGGSFILKLYKGKGEELGRGNYRDIKLTDQVIKLHEQVLDSYICEMVNINEMQLDFGPGRGNTGAIFVVRQLQEKYIADNKLRYFAFADSQKAFDHVSRKVLWWALKEPLGCGMGCACHSSHVMQCPESYTGQ